ncbi:histone deacetylase family protein [Albibacterium bauzanense]|uniref:Acetoin utilization deacetylase AcuC-like enzyme n=1 Tax=Albibacterium bauzanense TaxID=653929 RepID=A0A4R1M2J8_9SPHI|nr:histone deacetylase [Albibacterium bauzanense]TCK85240.1 acetoin utilization deacetylase AcuC-like enzyme [Albibacterium bauzanense]
MFKIAYHPLYVHPLPEGHRFPMVKYELLYKQLIYQGVVTLDNFFEPEPVNEDYILLAHKADYWQRLKTMQLSYQEIRRIGFPLSEQLIERELRIVEGTIKGSLFALDEGVSFNIAGGTHHSGSDWGEGFCLLNDQAIAAAYLLNKKHCKKILMIDLDVHQGNGTAEIFESNSKVFTFSMHCQNNFPFKKEVSNLDVGLPDYTGDDEYLEVLADNLKLLFSREQPDFVFYLSGVDILASDKLGKLSVSEKGCQERDLLVFQYCKEYKVPVQVSMGGGYSPQHRAIVDAHCNTFKQALKVF